jgi:hypothetical protein
MLVQLTMIIPNRYEEPEVDVGGEDDGIAATIRPRAESTTPVMVDTTHVRCFYPRHKRSDGTQPVGTRLTFSNSAGMPVQESFDEVAAKFGRAN